MARLIWISTGIAWAVASLTQLAGAVYYDPVTLLDWTAVLAYTVALLWLGLSVWCIGWLVPSRAVRVVAVTAAIPPIVTGLANLAEDGLGLAGASSVYVTGILLTVLGLVVLAGALLWSRARRLAGLMALVTIGLFLVAFGGGVVLLLLFEYLAGRTAWFRPEPPRTRPVEALG